MAKRTARRSGMSTLSVADLQRELRRRQDAAGRLIRKRAKLAARLASLDSEIAALGVATGSRGPSAERGAGRVRPRNEMMLVDALAKALDGKTMGVSEVAVAVQKAGYRTSSPNFRTIVNQALIASGKFKRVGRGQYTAK